MAKFLIDKGAKINVREGDRITPLEAAIKNGNEEVVRFVLDKSVVDIDKLSSSGYMPIVRAIEKRDLKPVNILIERGADVSARNNAGRIYSEVGRDFLDGVICQELDALFEQRKESFCSAIAALTRYF